MVSWSHRLLARRELSKFPINPITYKRARSRHNRCSLWRFDWTLIKHSLSTATASIPHWKVGRDRRYWFREYYHGLEKRWVFWVQTAAAVIYHSKRAREWEAEYREVLCLGDWSPLFRSPSSLSLFFLALTLDIIYSLFLSTLSPPSLQFCGFPAGHGSPLTIATALDGFAAISWMRICEFRTDAKHSASDRTCAIRNFKS